MVDGRQEEDKVVAEVRFGCIFLVLPLCVVLTGVTLLFGSSWLQVSAAYLGV